MSEEVCETTNLARCSVCGFWGRTDGPSYAPEFFQAHSCIHHLKEAVLLGNLVCQINHEAAERCAGERDAALLALMKIRDMSPRDQDDAWRLRHFAQTYLEGVNKNVLDCINQKQRELANICRPNKQPTPTPAQPTPSDLGSCDPER